MEYSYNFIRSIIKANVHYSALVESIDKNMNTDKYIEHLKIFYGKILEAIDGDSPINLGKVYASICQQDKNFAESTKEVYVIIPEPLDTKQHYYAICKVKGNFAEGYHYPNKYYMIYDNMGLVRYTFVNNSQMIFTDESAAQEFAEFYMAYAYFKNSSFRYTIREISYI